MDLNKNTSVIDIGNKSPKSNAGGASFTVNSKVGDTPGNEEQRDNTRELEEKVFEIINKEKKAAVKEGEDSAIKIDAIEEESNIDDLMSGDADV